jgi:signal transduction histidine kinase
MALSFVADAPPAVRWFARLFFLRQPLPEEVPEFAAALAWLRRRWLWVLGAYLLFVTLLVMPGLLRGKGPTYSVTAVLLPHVGLYLLSMSAAYAWVGFRINLGNLREFMRTYKRRQTRRATIVSAVVAALAGGIVGYTSGSTGALLGPSLGEWFHDTFTPGVLVLMFLLVITAVPEVIAQLRLRQSELTQQLLAAQTAQERLARQTAESELRLLQAQVEPHFLYNTLANLRYLVQTGSPDALRMTDALIEYLRTSVPDMRARHVTLGREADHAGHYLEIMRMRMGGRLSYDIDVPAGLRDVELPPLVVLTLVENAIKHGIGPRVEGGRVVLRAAAEGEGRVRVEVVDDGVGVEAATRSDAPSTGAGLRNVRGRLKLVYGDTAQLQVGPNAPRGTRAALQVPRVAPPPAESADVLMLTPDEARAHGLALPAASARNGTP